MTLRPLPRSRLDQLVPSLLQGQALVALVPATGRLPWAAEAAWEVARAAAHPDRRVALVDLWLEEPLLHRAAGMEVGDGIVDAFEYGVSLNAAAHEVNGVFFIAAGSDTVKAGEVFAHPRWPKLQAGFRSEDALLLVYLSPDGLRRLSALPDGVMVLAPDGITMPDPAMAAAAERGAPVLGVVCERYPGGAPGVRAGARPGEAGRAPRRRRTLIPALGIALVAAGGGALFARSEERRGGPPEAPAVAPRDTLAWTVQLAAYGTLEGALGHADALLAEGIPALVAPVVLGGTTAVWYRVLAGSFAARDSAAAARADLWRRGAAPEGQGDLLHAPYTLVLRGPLVPDSLRARGVPATRWPDGQVLLGAFETPEQAALAEALAARAGAQATLITRMGPTP